MMGAAPATVGGQLGRYELHGAIARGGMATVYVARMSGAAGFARTVAVKRLHPHLAADPAFSSMFVDEARLAARIRHPNVIDTLDVMSEGGELYIVMDFVLGETLAKLVKAAAARSLFIPPPVVASIVIGALEGLHAAHEATDERGRPLGIVHRDISPQNIMVAQNGVARVLDFGVAKAAGRIQETEGGELKGKLAYMAPEQLTRAVVDRRTDVFAMGVVLWEALTSRRLFQGDDAASTLFAILNESIMPPSQIVPGLLPAIDDVVMRALEKDPERRFPTARDMALALEAACLPAPARHAGKWVDELVGEAIQQRSEMVRAVEGAMPVQTGILSDDPAGSGSQRINSSARIAGPGAESWRHMPPPSGPGYSNVSSAVVPARDLTSPSMPSMPSMASRSMTGPMLPAQPMSVKRETLGILVAGGIVLAIFIAVGLVLGIRSLTKKPAEPPLEPTAVAIDTATAPATAVTAPPVTTTTAPPTATTATVNGEPVATTTGAAPTATTPPAATPAATAHAVPKPKPKPAVDCTDPFTVDANGVKRPKPQCFGH